MKYLIKFLLLLSIILGIISFLLFFYSITTLLTPNKSISYIESIDNIYAVIFKFSEIYKFTFIVWAFWATTRQLEISKNNYETSYSQIQFIQKDILYKKNKDITDSTLKQCNLYFQEIQIDYKELMESKTINGLPLNWGALEEITSESLRENYPRISEDIDIIDREVRNRILITLYKFEAFSSLFLHGNLDKELAKNIIGEIFLNQVSLLIGFIAYFRTDNHSIFGKNTLNLYDEWK